MKNSGKGHRHFLKSTCGIRDPLVKGPTGTPTNRNILTGRKWPHGAPRGLGYLSTKGARSTSISLEREQQNYC